MMIRSLGKFKMKAEAIRAKTQAIPTEERTDLSEREKLELMLQERDDCVRKLERFQTIKGNAITEMQSELNTLKKRQMENSYMHALEVGRLNREHEAITKRVETFKRDMEDESAVSDYAELVREMAPKSVDSNYVMKLQTQLTKAMKKMDGMTQQMVAIQESCDEVVESLLADIQEIVEERCKSELELMNQHAELKEHTRDMEEEYEEKIRDTEMRIGEMKDVIKRLDRKANREKEKEIIENDVSAKEKEENDDNKNEGGDENDGTAKEDKEDKKDEEEEEKCDKQKELQRLKDKLHEVTDQKAQCIHSLRLESREKKEQILKMQRVNERQEEKIEQLIVELNELNNDIEGGGMMGGSSSHDDDNDINHNGPEVVDGELLE